MRKRGTPKIGSVNLKSSLIQTILICTALPFVGHASTLTMDVSGTYSDHSTFSGSFVYDQNTNQVESGTIRDSSGPVFNFDFFKVILPPATYDGAAGTSTMPSQPGCRSNCQWFGLEFNTDSTSFLSPYLDLFFYGNPSTFAGGAIASSITYGDFFGGKNTVTSGETFLDFLSRDVVSGQVTATPEPGSMVLLFAGLGCLVFVYRRKAMGSVTQ